MEDTSVAYCINTVASPDADSSERTRVAIKLAKLNGTEKDLFKDGVVSALLKALGLPAVLAESEWRFRIQAIHALKHFGGVKAFDKLFELAVKADELKAVRSVAVESLSIVFNNCHSPTDLTSMYITYNSLIGCLELSVGLDNDVAEKHALDVLKTAVGAKVEQVQAENPDVIVRNTPHPTARATPQPRARASPPPISWVKPADWPGSKPPPGPFDVAARRPTPQPRAATPSPTPEARKLAAGNNRK